MLPTGRPQPEVQWWRGNRDDVHSYRKEQHGRVLVLEDVGEEDAGSYYCQASSSAGQGDPRQFNVYVECKYILVFCVCFKFVLV